MLSRILFAVLLSQISPAPVLSGRVLDVTGGVLRGAQVEVQCQSRRATRAADARGAFSFDGLLGERCTVTASQEGFVADRQPADLRKASPVVLEFRLAVRPYSSRVVITANRGLEEDASQVAQSATRVDAAALNARPFTIVTQALKEEAGVLAQQTTSAQGSPILRGFTGQRNLYLLDGVRYNTSAWRDGPSQYMAWLPSADLDRLEIVRGPGSAQYGSDSLGGTLGIFSVAPPARGAPTTTGTAGVAFGSANQLRSTDVGVGIERSRISARLAASAASVDDLRPGKEVDSHAAVTRFLGLPSSVIAANLEHTGYTQAALSGSVRVPIDPARAVSASYRYAQQQGAHRYDQEMGGNGRYRSEFGPQQLGFGLVRYESARQPGLDELTATFSINRQSDGRLDQTRPTARVDKQVNTTTAFGYSAQGTRAFSTRFDSSFGGEVYDEYIGGSRTLTETTGATSAARPDIPDGTRYTSVGLFWQQGVVVIPGRVHVRGGLRYGQFAFSSVANAALGVPEESIKNNDTTFNVGSVFTLAKSLNATVSVSRGFRAANAFDYGAIGLSGGAGFEISPRRAADLGGLRGSTDGATATSTGQGVGSLGPEVLYAYEAGLRWQSGRIGSSVTAFDLEFHDAIERRTLIFPGNVVGQDIAGYTIIRQDAAGRAYVTGEARPIATRVNVSRARITGFEADASLRATASTSVRVWGSSAKGTELETNTPRRRMPPAMGGMSVSWQRPGSRMWVASTLLAAASQERLSDGDIGDARIGASRTPASVAAFFNGTAVDRGLVKDSRLVATGETLAEVQARVLGGSQLSPMFTSTAGFVSLDVRAGFPLGSHMELTVIGENLADRNYRLHGSGVDEPGRGAHARLRVRF